MAASLLAIWLLLAAGSAQAGHVGVELDGIDGPLRDAVLAGLELNQYGTRDVTAAQAHRLYERAADQVRDALEPYGYYHAEVSGELRENGADYTAVLHVTPGDPVRIATLDIKLDGDADGQQPGAESHRRIRAGQGPAARPCRVREEQGDDPGRAVRIGLPPGRAHHARRRSDALGEQRGHSSGLESRPALPARRHRVRRRPVSGHVHAALRAVERRRFLHAGQGARAAAAPDRRRLLRGRAGAAGHREGARRHRADQGHPRAGQAHDLHRRRLHRHRHRPRRARRRHAALGQPARAQGENRGDRRRAPEDGRRDLPDPAGRAEQPQPQFRLQLPRREHRHEPVEHVGACRDRFGDLERLDAHLRHQVPDRRFRSRQHSGQYDAALSRGIDLAQAGRRSGVRAQGLFADVRARARAPARRNSRR